MLPVTIVFGDPKPELVTMPPDRFAQYKQWRKQLLLRDYQLAFYRKPTETWVFSDESGTHSGARYFGRRIVFENRRMRKVKSLGLGMATGNKLIDRRQHGT